LHEQLTCAARAADAAVAAAALVSGHRSGRSLVRAPPPPSPPARPLCLQPPSARMAPPCSSADLSGLVTFPQQLSLHLLLLQLYTAQAARAPCAPPCEIRHSAFTTGPAAVSIGGSVLECTGVYWKLPSLGS